jgi:hypothetical protein
MYERYLDNSCTGARFIVYDNPKNNKIGNQSREEKYLGI